MAALGWMPSGLGAGLVTGKRCTARAKSTSEQCKRLAHPGAATCVKHGSGAPHVRAAAARRLAAEQALRAAQPFARAGEVNIDPITVLQRELAEQAATVEALRAAVAALDPHDAVVGQGRGVLDLLGDRSDKVARLAADAIRLGIESRSEALTAQFAASLTMILHRLVSDLGLTAEQRESARTITATVLRELTGVVTAPVSDATPEPVAIEAVVVEEVGDDV